MEPEVKVLRLALIPADDIDTMISRFEPVRQYLETELGIPIEIFRATSYTAVPELLMGMTCASSGSQTPFPIRPLLCGAT